MFRGPSLVASINHGMYSSALQLMPAAIPNSTLVARFSVATVLAARLLPEVRRFQRLCTLLGEISTRVAQQTLARLCCPLKFHDNARCSSFNQQYGFNTASDFTARLLQMTQF